MKKRSRFIKLDIKRDTMPRLINNTQMPVLIFVGQALPFQEFTSHKDFVEVVVGEDQENVRKTMQVMFNQKERYPKIAALGVAEETDLLSALEPNNALGDAYWIASEGLTEDGHKALSDYAEDSGYIYMPTMTLEDATAYKESTDLLSKIYDRTFIMVTEKEGDNLGAALVSLSSGNFFGHWWPKFKTLNNMSPTSYTEDELTTIRNINANTYLRENGVNVVSDARVLSGEFLDIVQTEDYLRDAILTEIWNILTKTPKIAYIQKGIDLVHSGLIAALDKASQTSVGVLLLDENNDVTYTTSAPLRNEIDTELIKQRILPDLKFTAIPSGAVGSVEITGLITYDLNEEV